jgi:Uncharacterised nucleotidyltransferase
VRRLHNIHDPPATMRPEDELLLSCTRDREVAEVTERIRALLRVRPDWEHLIQTARRHGVIPLLYRGLNRAFPEAVPAATLTWLRDYFRENARRNLWLTEQLLHLLRLLESRGVPTIPFKGPTLAASAYGNLALREFTDLDLLVRERDVLKARALLISEGYRPREPMDRKGEAAHLRHAHAFTFRRDDEAFEVDLHWRVVERLSPLRVELNGVWQRAVPAPLAGASVLGLPPEDVLLMLYVHGCRSGWGRLKMVCDLAAFINSHPALDWELVTRRAGEGGSRRMLSLALLLASGLSGAVLPPGVRRLVRSDEAAQTLAALARQRLFRQSEDVPRMAESIAFYVRMRERMRDRARYCASSYWLTPNAKDRLALRLPTRLSFLYYFVRPVRLAREHGLGPLGRLLSRLLGF